MTNKFKLSITPLEDRTCPAASGTSVGVPLPPPPPPVVVVVVIKPPDTGMGNAITTTTA